MPALQQFFNAERTRRGWSVRETAKRAAISVSKAYAIVNGDDNVEFETFENIAAAFNMSPAELATAIGKGAAGVNPKRVPIHANVDQVPEEHLSVLDHLVRSLVPPVHAKIPHHPSAKGSRRSVTSPQNPDENGIHDTPQSRWNPLRPVLAFAVPAS